MEAEQSNAFWGALIAGAGGVLAMIRLAVLMTHPIPLDLRDASPGFGWSWDFAYERAMQEPHLTVDSAINRTAVPSPDQIILPLGEPVSISGLKLTYRGLTAAGRFRLDAAIVALDTDSPYPRDLSASEARRGFRLLDQHFVLLSLSPSVLRLRHLPN